MSASPSPYISGSHADSWPVGMDLAVAAALGGAGDRVLDVARRGADREPHPILDDRAGQREADVGVDVLVAGRVDRDRLRRAALARRGQLARRDVREDLAFELVAAGQRRDVDDAAGGAAVLGVVAAGDDLDLLDEVVDDRRTDRAVLEAGGVDAVDDVLVLERGRARERHAHAVALRAGGGAQGRLEGAARDGMFLV